MHRIKDVSRGGWIVVGIVVAMLLVPTAAFASGAATKVLKFTGIEGTSGNQADVSPSGQLLTTGNLPSESFASLNNDSGNQQPPNQNTSGSTCEAFGNMDLGASQGALITEVQVSIDATDSTDSIRVFNDDNCSGNAIVNFRAATIGENVIPFSTPIPAYGPDGYDVGGSGKYLSVVVAPATSGGPVDAFANVIVDGYAT